MFSLEPEPAEPSTERSWLCEQAMEECQLAAAEDLIPLLFFLCMDYTETWQ